MLPFDNAKISVSTVLHKYKAGHYWLYIAYCRTGFDSNGNVTASFKIIKK